VSVHAAPRRIGRPVRLGVDVRGALGLVGTLLKYLSLSALFPTAVALGYGEPPWPFLAAFAIAGGAGLGLERLGGAARSAAGSREGYLVVSLTWLLAAVFGALPFLFSGEPQLDRPIDALFEAMSGFTTTGATLVTDIEGLEHSTQMWRQFMQWLGGIGIIVLAIAVLPRLRVGGRQMLESELPGPEVDQLGERIRRTAQRLWILYVSLTAVEALILALLGWTGIDDKMSPYEAIAHAFTTIPTGGFSTENDSIGAFGAVTQWVIVVFMVLAGVNFALLWQAFARRRPDRATRDEEFRLYAVLLVVFSSILILELATEELAGSDEPIRNGVFQAVSIMTGTGYATVDFASWTTLGLMTLVLLMFIGGAAGSTTGSIKVVRHLLLGRSLRRELRQTLHPELVIPVRLNGSVIDERMLRALVSFILLYVGIFIVGTAVIEIDSAIQGPPLVAVDAISASAATLGNVGPALGPAGPVDSYEPFSDVSTFTMTLLMWLGRLEVIPIIVLLSRRYWRV
jgi:trk system potassium uptake protein TrkH